LDNGETESMTEIIYDPRSNEYLVVDIVHGIKMVTSVLNNEEGDVYIDYPIQCWDVVNEQD
jgi:hypothetical protein